MNKKLIIANWKNHPDSIAEAEQILDFINDHLDSNPEKELSLIICPPFVFLEEVGKILHTSHLEHNAQLGAQDIASDDSGAMTGEMSGPMLRKLGVSYVIVGHSERRWKLGESNEIVSKKLKMVLRNEMIPIVCIGEKTRDGDFKDFLQQQVEATFKDLNADEIGKCIIAYEPVWAISTNPNAKSDTPENALESINIIKDFLTFNFKLSTFNFLYGGSVNSKNVYSFIEHDQISGVLVGGASVNKEEFVEILRQV